ncbi:Early endosome antigen 1 [Halotydeus destructor]|nr:Early endosome antigen 1 [Halotydeus destructor]
MNRLSGGFKGIMNRINSGDSPSRESRNGSMSIQESGEPLSEQDREGFLCPLCLSGFPSADELQHHYAIYHSDSIDSNVLCSVCKMRFGSQTECEAHFLRHHSKDDDDTNELRQTISVDNSELKEELKRIETLLGTNSELELLRGQLIAMQQSKDLMLKEIVGLRDTLETEKDNSKKLEIALQTKTNGWNEEKRQLIQENEQLIEEKFKQVSSESDDSSQVYLEEISRLRKNNQDLSSKLDELDGILNEIKVKFDESEERNNDLRQRLDHTEAVFEKTENDHEQEIKELETKYKDEIDQLKQEFSSNEMKWEKQLQVSAESEATIENERRSLEHIVEILRDENNAKETLREKMETDFKSEKETMERSFDEKLNDLEMRHEAKVSSMQKVCEERKKEVEIYENEKNTLEKQMEIINIELKKVKDGLEQKVAESLKQEAVLKELQDKLSDMRKEFTVKEKEYQSEIRSLTETLVALRNKEEEDTLLIARLSNLRDDIESKLSIANDELKSLHEERNLRNEEAEQLKAEASENKRRYDDTLAALLDLGRENQSLQIEQAKLMGRKWADDSEVTGCQACDKQFTLTVRKHHCRNCGQIFCNECSTKQAAFANYKNKVRVCDPCFLEISQETIPL